MIEPRAVSPGTAVVPYVRRDPKIVQFAADGVAADVRVDSVDARSRTSVYAIRLAAAGDHLRGRLVGMLASGEPIELGSVAVTPGSVGGARLTVPLPRGGYEALYLEIRSANVLLRVEAPKPDRLRRTHPLVTGAAIAASVGVSLGAGSLALALPQPAVVDPPAHPVAGSAIRVPYATRGVGRASYAARYDDGAVFATGALDAPRGEIALALPTSAANRRVSVAVSLNGPLGKAAGVTSFAVERPAAPPAAAARVLSFAARRDPSAAGETVLASYLAVGDRGTVVLQDRRGKTIASAPFAHVGTSRLPVAAAYRDQPLTARIVVGRGETRAVASVALAPGGATAPVPATPNPDVPEAVTPLEPARRGANVGLVAVDGRPVAGRPLALRVMPHRETMHVELQDASGETVAERDVAPQATALTLPLPGEPGNYFVILTYARNGGQETVVRSVRAAAPPAQTSSR